MGGVRDCSLDSDDSAVLAGRREQGGETPGFIDVGEFLGQRSNRQLIKKGTAQWN
jgi:hypothetical protein